MLVQRRKFLTTSQNQGVCQSSLSLMLILILCTIYLMGVNWYHSMYCYVVFTYVTEYRILVYVRRHGLFFVIDHTTPTNRIRLSLHQSLLLASPVSLLNDHGFRMSNALRDHRLTVSLLYADERKLLISNYILLKLFRRFQCVG